MKKLIVFFAALLITGIASAQKDLIYDPNAEIRPLNGSFTAVQVSGGIDIYISQADQEAVAVSASEERFKAGIKTDVSNGLLRIYYEGEKGWSSKNRKIKVYISAKTLNKIEASGASDVVVIGALSGSYLRLVLSGASDFKGEVKLDSLNLDLSGASDVHIKGKATAVVIETSGASDVKGYDLVAETCTASASGASDINITVNKEINAHASGASDIYFRGDAVIKDIHTSGASNVNRKKAG